MSCLLIFGAFTPLLNSVSAKESSEPVLDQKTIDLADSYIDVINGKFEISNEKELKKKVGEEKYNKIINEVNDKNNVLSQISTEEKNNMQIVGNTITFEGKTDAKFQVAASKGRNAITTHWWGYKVYLNDNLTSTTAQALAAGGGAATLVGIWAPWFSIPTAVLKAVAASAALVLGGSATILLTQNKGKGVYLRFTGIVPAHVIYTGTFPQ